MFVLTLLCVGTNIVFAQSYSITPNDTIEVTKTLNETAVMNFTLQHTANDTIVFNWKKLSVTMDTAWNAYLCDNGACYPNLPDSGSSANIVVGDNGLMLLHCTPKTNFGTAIIRYTIYATHTPLQVDTLTYIIHSNSAATGINNTSVEKPFIYVANQNLYLKNINEEYNNIFIYDLNGKIIFQTNYNSNIINYPLPFLNTGIYFLQLDGSDKNYKQKIFINN